MSKPCGTSGYEAATTTLVRMAFKAFELGFPCIFGELDPTVGALAESQKAKLDKMKDWVENPFHEYECKKALSHYRLVKKHAKMNCSRCKSAPVIEAALQRCVRSVAHGDSACSAHKRK